MMHVPHNAAVFESFSEEIRQAATLLNEVFKRPLLAEEEGIADKLGRIFQGTNLSKETLFQLWLVYAQDVMHSNELDVDENKSLFLSFLLGVKLVVRRRSSAKFDAQKAEEKGEKAALLLRERLSVEGG